MNIFLEVIVKLALILVLLGCFSSLSSLPTAISEVSLSEKKEKILLFSNSPQEIHQKHSVLLKKKKQLSWSDDYAHAISIAQASNKPLLIAFLGSEWCPWSEKLISEVLIDQRFTQALKDELLFVWVDVPEYLSQEGLQNTLKEKYQVQELPTLVIVHPNEEEISRVGYLPYEPEKYAGHLKQILFLYQEFKNLQERRSLPSLSLEKLKTLYEQASLLGCKRYREEILLAGLQIDTGTFFLLEHYADLLKTKKMKNEHVVALRKKIVSKDPKNIEGAHLSLAVLEFEALSRRGKKGEDPQVALVPLIDYIKRFGSKDVENHWKVEMMISQYLFSKNRILPALEHAQASYAAAPEQAKKEIALTINYLSTHLLSNP